MQKKKILYIITKSNWGGAQKYVHDLATSNLSDLFDVHVLAGGDGELIKKLSDFKNIKITQSDTIQNTLNPVKFIKIFLYIIKIIKEEDPDIIHINSSLIGVAGSLAGKLLKKKIIFTAHGWPFNENRYTLTKLVFRFLMLITVQLSHKVIAVSENIKNTAPRIAKINYLKYIKNKTNSLDLKDTKDIKNINIKIKKIQVIYPGIEKFENKNLRKLSSLDNNIHIVSVGEINKNKNHISFIKEILNIERALDQVKIHYHIIGQDSGEKEEVARYANSKNIKIIFHGHVPSAHETLSQYDIFILPSYTEALGYVVLEALQNNIPVVARAVGGVPEIIKDLSDSYLYTHDSELKNIILNIINKKNIQAEYSNINLAKDSSENNIEKEIANTKNFIEDKFSKEKMINETLEIYQQALASYPLVYQK